MSLLQDPRRSEVKQWVKAGFPIKREDKTRRAACSSTSKKIEPNRLIPSPEKAESFSELTLEPASLIERSRGEKGGAIWEEEKYIEEEDDFWQDGRRDISKEVRW